MTFIKSSHRPSLDRHRVHWILEKKRFCLLASFQLHMTFKQMGNWKQPTKLYVNYTLIFMVFLSLIFSKKPMDKRLTKETELSISITECLTTKERKLSSISITDCLYSQLQHRAISNLITYAAYFKYMTNRPSRNFFAYSPYKPRCFYGSKSSEFGDIKFWVALFLDL